MDKRTLLAFALMFVVLIGWNLVFSPPPPETDDQSAPSEVPTEQFEAPPTVSQTTPATPPETTTTVEPPVERVVQGGQGSFVPASAEIGVPIQVHTDLFTAQIDPVGGDILGWQLAQFALADGSAVDLVPSRSLLSNTERAHALAVLFDDRRVDLGRVEFRVNRRSIALSVDEPQAQLVLEADAPNGDRVRLVYEFDNSRYGFDVDFQYESKDALVSPRGLEVAWPGGISNTEPDSSREYQEFKAAARVGEDVHKKKFGDLRKDGGAKGRAQYEGSLGWAGVLSQYFLSLVVPSESKPGVVRFDGDAARHIQTFSAEMSMARSPQSSVSYGVFMGPIDVDALAHFDQDPFNAQVASGVVDMGFALFRPVSMGVLVALKFLYGIIPNYGFVIIIFSALTKLLFYPLTKSSTQSMRKMQDIQPQLARLKEKHKDDQQAQSQEMLRLYKENGINPAGGCLPLLVQMPVFWALFTILRKTIELRQADFMLWMTDLSQPDVLARLPFSLPILGDKLCLLPFLMAAGMWWQTKISSSGTPAVGGGMMAQQAKMMGTLMPIMMFVMFYNSPSGLVLYWFVNTVLTAAQTWRIQSKMKNPVDLTPQAEPA